MRCTCHVTSLTFHDSLESGAGCGEVQVSDSPPARASSALATNYISGTEPCWSCRKAHAIVCM